MAQKQPRDASPTREERLKAALKTNLARRKAQAMARGEKGDGKASRIKASEDDNEG
jgi:hypothetical protein